LLREPPPLRPPRRAERRPRVGADVLGDGAAEAARVEGAELGDVSLEQRGNENEHGVGGVKERGKRGEMA